MPSTSRFKLMTINKKRLGIRYTKHVVLKLTSVEYMVTPYIIKYQTPSSISSEQGTDLMNQSEKFKNRRIRQ